jgi:hypothetical protein
MQTDRITKLLLAAIAVGLLFNAPKAFSKIAAAAPPEKAEMLPHFTMDKGSPLLPTGNDLYVRKEQVEAMWKNPEPQNTQDGTVLLIGSRIFPVRESMKQVMQAFGFQ